MYNSLHDINKVLYLKICIFFIYTFAVLCSVFNSLSRVKQKICIIHCIAVVKSKIPI